MPDASFGSCYEVLRHTYTILKENGSTVVLAYNREKSGFTIFDIPFLHEVTIRRLGLEELKRHCKYPVLFHPVACFRFMVRFSKRGHRMVECIDNKVSDFCRERNIRLILLEV